MATEIKRPLQRPSVATRTDIFCYPFYYPVPGYIVAMDGGRGFSGGLRYRVDGHNKA